MRPRKLRDRVRLQLRASALLLEEVSSLQSSSPRQLAPVLRFRDKTPLLGLCLNELGPGGHSAEVECLGPVEEAAVRYHKCKSENDESDLADQAENTQSEREIRGLFDSDNVEEKETDKEDDRSGS